MIKSCVVLQLLLIHELSARVRFKANVFKDPFKIRRLARFKIELCNDIDHLIYVHESKIPKYGINKIIVGQYDITRRKEII